MSVRIGDSAVLSQTLTEMLLTAYCELTQDLDPLHVDEQFAASTPYGRRIAPGGLIVGWMLAAAAKTTGHTTSRCPRSDSTASGTQPRSLGDSVQIRYNITEFDGDCGLADVVVNGLDGGVVAVAEHVFKVLR